MRPIQSFIVMTMVVSSFLVVFYSTRLMETSYDHRAFTEEPPPPPHWSPRVHVAENVKTQVLQPQAAAEVKMQVLQPQAAAATAATRDPEAHNVSVSDGLKATIPQNGAYWNRLLHAALKALEGGGVRPGRRVPWSSCRQTNHEFLQTNVHDFASYPVLFQTFVEGMSCRSPPVLINPRNKCVPAEDGGGGGPPFLLLAIKSSPGNFARRQAVRETWGQEGVYKGGLAVRTVFLLGSSTPDDPDVTLLLETEGTHFGDLLQWDFHESFLNLTLKMNSFLEWGARSCPRVAFVFSGDDDVFVNTPALLDYLQSRGPPGASQLYVGQVIASASPLRDPKSKYYIPPSFYEGPYPPYTGGGGFLFSGAALQHLYALSRVIPAFPIDDVYVGMCFKALGAAAEAHGGFQTFDVMDKDRENLCVHKNLLLVHQRSPAQLKRLWRGIRSPLLTC